MKAKLIKAGACFLGVLGVIDLCCMFAEKCGVEISLSPGEWVLSWIVLCLVWFLVDGLLVSGFLVKRVEIDLPNLRTCINIFAGDLLEQSGCAIIPSNDFFDTVVNETIVAAKSVDGQMIKRFWVGNVHEFTVVPHVQSIAA